MDVEVDLTQMELSHKVLSSKELSKEDKIFLLGLMRKHFQSENGSAFDNAHLDWANYVTSQLRARRGCDKKEYAGRELATHLSFLLGQICKRRCIKQKLESGEEALITVDDFAETLRNSKAIMPLSLAISWAVQWGRLQRKNHKFLRLIPTRLAILRSACTQWTLNCHSIAMDTGLSDSNVYLVVGGIREKCQELLEEGIPEDEISRRLDCPPAFVLLVMDELTAV